jgi:beta-mannosidase
MKSFVLTEGWSITQIDNFDVEAKEMASVIKGDTSYKAQVPGDIHHDLMAAGVIDDPYYSDHSIECGWVTEKDWCYHTKFIVPEGFEDEQMKLLVSGVDVYGFIFLNGVRIGTTDNMFRSFKFDVKNLLKKENDLHIVLKSVKNSGCDFDKKDYFACFNTDRIFIRKAQCHFGWDWAPDFPATGIYQTVAIISEGNCAIEDVNVRTRIDGHITLFTILDRTIDRMKKSADKETKQALFNYEDASVNYQLRTTISYGDQTYVKTMPVQGNKNLLNIKVENPALWWPKGHGDQPLYAYTVELLDGEQQLDVYEGTFGIREVATVEEPKEDGGFSFQIKVNGKYIFAKGANWVPLDIMTGVIEEKKYRKAIDMALDANFNMLRIWGGGIYEKDLFYQLCNEQGIMVWQDFMFACSDIPDDQPWFSEHIIPEIEEQVKRLRNHPSVVMWCGGNEKTGSFGAMKSYGDNTFNYLIRGIVGHLDPTRYYAPSSPFSYTDYGNDLLSGDTHCNSYQPCLSTTMTDFRNVLAGYKTAFASEIAVQGSSRLKSLRKFIPEDKLWPTNDIWDLHFTRNPYDGTSKTFVGHQKSAASELFGDFSGVQDFVKKSMVMHSEFVRAEAEYYYARKETCGGAMFWMYSDVWPSGTWAIVDYYMEPKPAYYAAKRAFEPYQAIITQLEKGTVLRIVNDTLATITDTYTYGQKHINGTVIWEETVHTSTEANSAVEIAVLEYQKVQDSYLFCTTKTGQAVTYFPMLWKDIAWVEPKINIAIIESEAVNDGYKTVLKLTTDHYARTVKIDVMKPEVTYSDNFFDIEAGGSKPIEIVSEVPLTIEDIRLSHWLSEWDD